MEHQVPINQENTMATKIEWCDESRNSIKGCTKISPGCNNCYACELIKKDGGEPHKITFHEDKLQIPQSWKKSKIIFMNSMSDIFHHHVPDEWIDRIFNGMHESPHHHYMILTKRPERMQSYCKTYYEKYNRFPKSLWLGVTAEDQQRANERVPLLLDTIAYHHFVSVEPMLEPIKLTFSGKYKLDWTIVGGERSWNNARFMNPDWPRDIRDQCKINNVPFFMKQMTNDAPIPVDLDIKEFPSSLK